MIKANQFIPTTAQPAATDTASPDLAPVRTLTAPVRQAYDFEGEFTRLVFPGESVAPSGAYSMRGGVCWPLKLKNKTEGYAVLLGLERKSKKVFVFEEAAFVTVDPVVTRSGSIEPFAYLTPFLNEAWAKYFCRTYYWNQDGHSNSHYLRQIFNSEMIPVKPTLPDVEWADDATALGELYRLDAAGRLIYRRGGGLMRALEVYEADEKTIEPALHATLCALLGMARIYGGMV